MTTACRRLDTTRDEGATTVVPTLRPEAAGMQIRAWSDPENVTAGSVLRSPHAMFEQGDREPWTHMLEHAEEQGLLPAVGLDDGSLVYP